MQLYDNYVKKDIMTEMKQKLRTNKVKREVLQPSCSNILTSPVRPVRMQNADMQPCRMSVQVKPATPISYAGGISLSTRKNRITGTSQIPGGRYGCESAIMRRSIQS